MTDTNQSNLNSEMSDQKPPDKILLRSHWMSGRQLLDGSRLLPDEQIVRIQTIHHGGDVERLDDVDPTAAYRVETTWHINLAKLHVANEMVVRKDRARLRHRIGLWLSRIAAVVRGGSTGRLRYLEWQTDLRCSPRKVRFAVGFVVAAVKMRVHDGGRVLMRLLCWTLESEVRTWIPVGALLIICGWEVANETGMASAVIAVATAIGTLYMAIRWLRRRWGVLVKRRNRSQSNG